MPNPPEMVERTLASANRLFEVILRLAAFWLSEGAYGYSRDSVLEALVRPNAVMDTHPRTRASQEPTGHRLR
jgi:hypothetical protein